MREYIQSEIEWKDEYSERSFDLRDWEKFLDFFQVDGETEISASIRKADAWSGNVAAFSSEDKIVKLKDLPKLKTETNQLRVVVSTKNKLVDFLFTANIVKAFSVNPAV